MNTIRQLCDRCIVLDKGKIVLDGAVEEAIGVYLGIDKKENEKTITFDKSMRQDFLMNKNKIELYQFELLEHENYQYHIRDHIRFRLKWKALFDLENVSLRVKITSSNGIHVAGYFLDSFVNVEKGEYSHEFDLSLQGLMYGKYAVSFVFSYSLIPGRTELIEAIMNAFSFEIKKEESDPHWESIYWGAVKFDDIRMIK